MQTQTKLLFGQKQSETVFSRKHLPPGCELIPVFKWQVEIKGLVFSYSHWKSDTLLGKLSISHTNYHSTDIYDRSDTIWDNPADNDKKEVFWCTKSENCDSEIQKPFALFITNNLVVKNVKLNCD